MCSIPSLIMMAAANLHIISLFASTAYFFVSFYWVKEANRNLVRDTLALYQGTSDLSVNKIFQMITNIHTIQECMDYRKSGNDATYSEQLFREMSTPETFAFYDNTRIAIHCLQSPHHQNILINRFTREILKNETSMALTVFHQPTLDITDINTEMETQIRNELVDRLIQLHNQTTEDIVRSYFNELERNEAQLSGWATAAGAGHRIHTPTQSPQNTLRITPERSMWSKYVLFAGVLYEMTSQYLFEHPSHTPFRDILDELIKSIRKYARKINEETVRTRNSLDDMTLAIQRIYNKIFIAYNRTVRLGSTAAVLGVQYVHFVSTQLCHRYKTIQNA